MRAYMAAMLHPAGHLGVFPRPTWDDPHASGMADTMAHEAGHVLTYDEWGYNPTSEGWTAWRQAMAQDVIRVSSYAGSSMIEDSAETLLVYFAVRSRGDKELMQEFATLMPSRWEILRGMFGNWSATAAR
jgi:hypothetical protein